MANFKRGDTFTKTFQITNSVISDWSSFSGRSQLREYFVDGTVLSEFDFAWIDTATGVFSISATETQHYPPGTHFYDVELTDGTVKLSTPTKELIVDPDVTKD